MFSEEEQEPELKDLASIAEELAPRHTTAAYLTFSDGHESIVLEKDFSTAMLRHSSTFIAATNHDEEDHKLAVAGVTPAAGKATSGPSRLAAGLEELLEESKDRLQCISRRWESRVRRTRRRLNRSGGDTSAIQAEATTTVSQNEVIDWVSAYPTTNEQTHFAAVMDATSGHVIWNRAYADPATFEKQQD